MVILAEERLIFRESRQEGSQIFFRVIGDRSLFRGMGDCYFGRIAISGGWLFRETREFTRLPGN